MPKTIRQYLDDVYCFIRLRLNTPQLGVGSFIGFIRLRRIQQKRVYLAGSSLVGSEANLSGLPDVLRRALDFILFFLFLRSLIFMRRSRSPLRSFPDRRSNLTPIPFSSTRTTQPFSLSSFFRRVAGKTRFRICPMANFFWVIIKAPPRLIFLT